MLETIAGPATPKARRPRPVVSPRQLTLTWWAPGPAAGHGPVFISVTDFHVRRVEDLLRVYGEGWRLRRAWPSMSGAVGMWLWSKPQHRRCGSVSVWRDEQHLLRFVRCARHREIMRRYRDVGELSSSSWLEDHFDPTLVWGKAAGRLAVRDHARWAREAKR
jgi:hypothetical protein